MLKIVLDSNVLISSIVFGGNPRKIVDMIIAGKITLVVSEPIIDEVKEVLAGSKFQYPPAVLRLFIDELLEISELVEPQRTINIIEDDPDDNKILECAVEAGADYIITGDKHLLKRDSYNHIKILNPADFLKKISKKHRVASHVF